MEGFLGSWRVLVDLRLDFLAVLRLDREEVLFAFLAGIILSCLTVYLRGL